MCENQKLKKTTCSHFERNGEPLKSQIAHEHEAWHAVKAAQMIHYSKALCFMYLPAPEMGKNLHKIQFNIFLITGKCSVSRSAAMTHYFP